MQFLPLGSRVLLRRDDAETMYKGIIHLPDKGQEKPQMCTVIAVGPDVVVEGLIVAGDKVLIGKYSGTEIKLEGQELLLVKAEDVLGTLSE